MGFIHDSGPVSMPLCLTTFFKKPRCKIASLVPDVSFRPFLLPLFGVTAQIDLGPGCKITPTDRLHELQYLECNLKARCFLETVISFQRGFTE